MKKIRFLLSIITLVFFCGQIAFAQQNSNRTSQIQSVKNKMTNNNQSVNYSVQPATNQITLNEPVNLGSNVINNRSNKTTNSEEGVKPNVKSIAPIKAVRVKKIISNKPLTNNKN